MNKEDQSESEQEKRPTRSTQKLMRPAVNRSPESESESDEAQEPAAAEEE